MWLAFSLASRGSTRMNSPLSDPALCPALFVAAPASGQGKTTVTAALARLHVRQGRKVRVFKCGPDFLDPQIHAMASDAPCQNIDLWMCGAADAAWRLAEAARSALPASAIAVIWAWNSNWSSTPLDIMS